MQIHIQVVDGFCLARHMIVYMGRHRVLSANVSPTHVHQVDALSRITTVMLTCAILPRTSAMRVDDVLVCCVAQDIALPMTTTA